MSDLKLGTDGDLYLDDDGDAELVTGADAVRQNWLIVVRTFLGDWFRDPRIGVDWYALFEKQSDALRIRAALVRATLLVSGVSGVESLQVLVDPHARTMRVLGRVKLNSGELVNLTYSDP